MNRLTYRDNKGRPHWAPEIKAEGFDIMVRRTVAEYEDRLERIESGRNKRKGRPVIATAEDGTTTEYASVKDAAFAVGVNVAQIYVACQNGRRIRGFQWDYKEDKHG